MFIIHKAFMLLLLSFLIQAADIQAPNHPKQDISCLRQVCGYTCGTISVGLALAATGLIVIATPPSLDVFDSRENLHLLCKSVYNPVIITSLIGLVLGSMAAFGGALHMLGLLEKYNAQ